MPYDPMNQVHPGPLEGIDRIHADTTQARTGNTEREQETWFAGVEEGQRRTEHNAAVRRSADGWKLVPIEPTPEMIKAWHDTYSKAVIKTGRSNRAYAAMLAAAPSPAPSAPGDAQKVYHFEQRSRFGPWIEVEKPTAKSVEFVKLSDAPAAGAQKVMIDFDQVGSAGPFRVVNGKVAVPAITVRDLVRMAARAAGDALTDAARDVLAERQRQISAEGWTPEHDDKNTAEQLALAAVCYALPQGDYTIPEPPEFWPWDVAWWKPGDRRRELVKAGALVLAEIERLDRAAIAAQQSEGSRA
ncbi:hypothetical protein [Bordetella bronchiseptica]|uniref:hypothetical protein n=1 Tax=Bordetella bronchiseptica TaxID=518 RepID=UPI0012473C93|nr:hypothetical protein [Bordetella bronchiseptica]KAB1444168.1 hypothetical protein F7D00_21135 [Bordetella bronchiseptica]KAB1569274.1 hypothetical protein F7890_21135 [Bordetella bronchiseptica]